MEAERVPQCVGFSFCMGEEVNFALNVTEIEFPFLGMTLPPPPTLERIERLVKRDGGGGVVSSAE